MKKILTLLLCVLMTITLCACAQRHITEEDDIIPAYAVKVGISMPDEKDNRWVRDSAWMESQLIELKYEVETQFAGGNIARQVSQLNTMMDNGCKVLIIAPVDTASLTAVLERAKSNEIKIISYDSLILNTDALNYYVTFDEYSVGILEGKRIESVLKLGASSKKTYNIEFTYGSQSDLLTPIIYDGVMEILEPYFENGVLLCPSGELEKNQICSANSEEAEERLENIYKKYYADPAEPRTIDAIICSEAELAVIAQRIFSGTEYTGKKSVSPIIVSYGCGAENIRLLSNGLQDMAVVADTREEAAYAVMMADYLIKEMELKVNAADKFRNGKITVPAYICEYSECTLLNYEDILFDSGMYDRENFKTDAS